MERKITITKKDQVNLKVNRTAPGKLLMQVHFNKKKVGNAIIDDEVWDNKDESLLKNVVSAIFKAKKAGISMAIVEYKKKGGGNV